MTYLHFKGFRFLKIPKSYKTAFKNSKVCHLFSEIIAPRCYTPHKYIFTPIKPHATIGQIDGMITDLGVFQIIYSSAV